MLEVEAGGESRRFSPNADSPLSSIGPRPHLAKWRPRPGSTPWSQSLVFLQESPSSDPRRSLLTEVVQAQVRARAQVRAQVWAQVQAQAQV